jgi:hypothetical protein
MIQNRITVHVPYGRFGFGEWLGRRMCRALEKRLQKEYPDNKIIVIPTNWKPKHVYWSFSVGSLHEEHIVRHLTALVLEEVTCGMPLWAFK